MPNPVEGLLEVYEDTVEILLVLEILFTEDSQVEDLLCVVFLPAPNPACSSAMIIILRLRLQSVQYDLQRDFA